MSTILPSRPGPIALLDLLSEFRYCDATDPRDKVFAMVDIAQKSQWSDPSSPAISEADYKLDVQEVYLKAAHYILRDTGDLTLLNQVQDQSTTRVEDLPSWVPDSSTSLGRSTFHADGQLSTGKTKQPCYIPTIMPGNILSVEGICAYRVAAVAEAGSCYFTSTAKLALGTPAWHIKEPTLVINFPGPRGDKTREPFAVSADRFQPPPSDSSSNAGSLATPRVEALWRTLIADACDGSHPASVTYGFAFADWFCMELMQDVTMLETVKKMGSTKGASGIAAVASRMHDKIAVWKALDAGEVGGFYTLKEWREIAKRMRSYNRPFELEKEKHIQAFLKLENGGMRFLPDQRRTHYFMENYERNCPGGKKDFFDTLKKWTSTEDTPMDAAAHANLALFKARIDEVKRLRTMLRSESGHLGMGPLSTLKKDEI